MLITNVYPLKPSEGFVEREFLTNIVQTTSYQFLVSNRPVKFAFTQTNSSVIGVYVPSVQTNFIPKSSHPAISGQLEKKSE
jgi:hypothetical protein